MNTLLSRSTLFWDGTWRCICLLDIRTVSTLEMCT